MLPFDAQQLLTKPVRVALCDHGHEFTLLGKVVVDTWF